ncbi:signal recognition particle receptor beta subunit-domain-containing protein [Xylogone sp. PMI_703]|nr:signal recognition particle receptor beta subunit-domain-containing protein [Xylogone sp. PMI_703]
MSDIIHWATAAMSPPPLALVIAVLVALLLPILLHTFVFHASGLTTLPSILVVGPSGSGKTSLLTMFERGTVASTHTSQTPIAVECSLPVDMKAESDKFRSTNDPSSQAHKKFLLIDTPGHGKLRYHALDQITKPQNLRGIIFLVDAAVLSAGDDGLRQTADYLHDILLLLQKRGDGGKAPKPIPVLVAANKMDLFMALPATLVKSNLEAEITKVRSSRSKGLLDSGISMGDSEEDDWLGEMGSKEFRFAQMEEFSISVDISSGSVLGDDATEWFKWVAGHL